MRRLLKSLSLILLFSIFTTGCFLFKKEPLLIAQDLVSQGKKKEAVALLLSEIEKESRSEVSLEMATMGSQLAHLELRDYSSAAAFYRYLINYSKNPEDQISALRYLGVIYFDHLKDYERALEIFEMILRYPLNNEEKARYRLMLGKSHYNLAQLDQAEAELASFNDMKVSKGLKYEGDVFQSNILVSKKQHEEAAQILKRLLKQFPERARSDGLEMNLVACYEDMKDFDAAITAMEEMKVAYPDKEFLEMRISRLKERKNNMPGARGLRK